MKNASLSQYHRDPQESHSMNMAMRVSFLAGIFLLIMKLYAYWITGSAAILSDCSESVIHIFAVGFATFSMWLSLQPADKNHQYGHDKISFFSAGFEGAMIAFAALYIMYESVMKLLYGCELSNLTQGISFIFSATVINGILGIWLIAKGKRYGSLILKANGKHVLTDCITSLCVVMGLIVVEATHLFWLDPVIAIGAACHILVSGARLVVESIGGLMDSSDEALDIQARQILEEFSDSHNVGYHHLRHRKAGNLTFLEVHLLFNDDISVVRAHEIATEVEATLHKRIGEPLDITTHLEPKEHHDITHSKFSVGY